MEIREMGVLLSNALKAGENLSRNQFLSEIGLTLIAR